MTLQRAMTVIQECIASACPADCPALVGQLETLRATAWSKMVNGQGPAAIHSPSAEPLLTIQQVAQRLKVKESYVYELCRTNALASVRMGKYVRVSEHALTTYTSTHETLKGP